MICKQDRDELAGSIRTLHNFADKLGKSSQRSQKVVWKGKSLVVFWELVFDEETLEFEPLADIIPEDISIGSRLDPEFQQLALSIEKRLSCIPEHDEWPSEIPEQWLADRAEPAKTKKDKQEKVNP